jgi:hypothetical protein
LRRDSKSSSSDKDIVKNDENVRLTVSIARIQEFVFVFGGQRTALGTLTVDVPIVKLSG